MSETQQEVVEKVSDKEMNFRALENQMKQERAARLEIEQKLAQERAAREEIEKRFQSKEQQEDDNYSEPYVDEKRLEKKLAKYEERSRKTTQQEIQNAVSNALQEERRGNWIKQNSDFYEVMKHADKFADSAPELAESILQMPEGFERQKLVYANIKALGLHQDKPKEPSIQDRINQNQRSGHYQPSMTSSAPFMAQGNFSDSGKKQAWEKMQELKRMNGF